MAGAGNSKPEDEAAPSPPRVHEGERLVDEIEETRARLHANAMRAIGITGDAEAPPLRRVMRESGVGWYPLLALSLLFVVDRFQGYGLAVLGPEISRSLGISRGGLAGIQALSTIALTVATLPIAAAVQSGHRRGVVAMVTALAWSATTLGTGFAAGALGLALILIADGASSGSVQAVHRPLLMDSYPPEIRVRVLSFYRGAAELSNIVSPLSVGLLSAVVHLTWRGVFTVMGVASFLAAFFAFRLRDPGFGRWDSGRIRNEVRGTADAPAPEDSVDLGFFEIVRRLMLIPTIRRVLAAFAVLGMLLVPFSTYLFFFLEERWAMGPGARAVFFAGLAPPSMLALSIAGRRAEGIFRSDPSRLVRLAALFLAAGVAVLALGIFVPIFALMVVLFALSSALLAVLAPLMNIVTLSIVQPVMRPHASALTGIFTAAVGGFGGLLLLGGIDRRFGTGGAIASLAVPGLVAAGVLLSAARTVNDDVARMVDEIVEEEELRGLRRISAHVPMLRCRNVDFSYGSLQVLFKVSFTVDDGEMVALLGTNGAGKSTLLRVISGLGLPTRGSVRFRGADITYVDAERRLRMGITQIPGGRGIFAPLTVVENLRLFGYTHGRDRTAVEHSIDQAFEAFPRLGERRQQTASTLSGGEQQMLALARAFVVKPRLLLIDELSLGLAPKVVTELLEVVRSINRAGTAVVLVEQSVTVALSLVDHAYFMEKGEIRFDGRAADLAARSDLLRSVFLEGAAKVLAARDQ